MSSKKKSTGKVALKSILRRAFFPAHLYRVISLQRNRKKTDRAYDDAQLKLYSEILPSGFLHYGYFEDATIKPEDISLNALEEAQLNYALKLVDLIKDKNSAVLDIGCGMGGLIKVLLDKGFDPIALSPDKNQIRHIGNKYPGVKTVQAKFEDMDITGLEKHFGTLITSESLQYLKLDIALPLMNKLLKDGGQWVACDYFRIGEGHEKSGHNWEQFLQKLDQNGFQLSFEKDITPHVTPTIAYAYMWANRLAIPLKNYIVSKIKTKQPGIHYILEEAIRKLDDSIAVNLETVNPLAFAKNKKYVLMLIERKK